MHTSRSMPLTDVETNKKRRQKQVVGGANDATWPLQQRVNQLLAVLPESEWLLSRCCCFLSQSRDVNIKDHWQP